MHAVLDHIEDISQTIKTFWFKPEGRARYIAGQFVEITHEHESHDSRGPRRWFTLSSSPTEPLLGITTKFMPEDGSSFKKSLATMPIGTRVHVSEPMGDFVLPKDATIPLIFAANGIGITPLRSMTQWLIDTGQHRDITIYYSGRSPQDMPFTDFFTHYYGTSLHLQRGERLLPADILTASIAKPESIIYLAGPERMVEELSSKLEQSGVAKHRIVMDLFLGYTES